MQQWWKLAVNLREYLPLIITLYSYITFVYRYDMAYGTYNSVSPTDGIELNPLVTPSVVFHIKRAFRRDRLEVGLKDSISPCGKPLKARLPRRLKRLLLVQTLERSPKFLAVCALHLRLEWLSKCTFYMKHYTSAIW